MRKQMKKIGTVLLAAAMTFGLVGCGAKKDSTVVATEAETPSEENEKVIRIGGSGSEDSAMNLELMNVAYKQGYLEDELKKAGYRLDFTFFPGGGPALNEALAAGELDAVVYGDLPAFVGKSNGADTTLIASVNADLQYGIVVANDEIQDPKDLEGKNVIVPEGTAIQYFWENYAAEKRDRYVKSQHDQCGRRRGIPVNDGGCGRDRIYGIRDPVVCLYGSRTYLRYRRGH